jgi:sugar lactone lactonase YvrE
LQELGSPAFYGMEISFPASMTSQNAGFTFAFSNVGDGDWLSVSFKGVTLWEGLGSSFQPDEVYEGLIPTAGLAGQHGVLLFVLTSVGQPNARVAIGDPATEIVLSSPYPATATLARAAGTGVAGWSGDGGPASLAQLNSPSAIAADSDGNLYVADRDNHRIRRIDAVSGDITTVAGDGNPTFAGDGLTATLASLNSPTDVALDADGNLFIADRNNHRIRRVDAVSHLISTVAGNGSAGFTGDNVAATATALNMPTGIAFDANGDFYIADSLNHRLRRVSAGTITTVAGNGSTTTNGNGPATAVSLVSPQRVAFAGGDELVISEGGQHRIRRLDLGDSLLTTIAGLGRVGDTGDFGPAIGAALSNPGGLVVGSNGDIWVADRGNHEIRHIELSSGLISSEIGSGTPGYQEDPMLPGSDRLHAPEGLALLANGKVLVADTANHVVREATFVVADLQLVASAAPSTVTIGDDVVLVFEVANNGPSDADFGLFSLDFPVSYLNTVSISSSLGTCQPGPPATCELGTLVAGQAATITVVLHAAYLGTTTLQAAVASSRADLSLGNNVLNPGISVVLPDNIFADGF